MMKSQPNFTHRSGRKRIFLVCTGIALLVVVGGGIGGFLFVRARDAVGPVVSPTATSIGLPVTQKPMALTQYVHPLIGTGVRANDAVALGGFAGGNVFPGASYPHGMVQWSPDTSNSPGGYRYDQTVVHGFSLTHFSGRGCNAYQDFPFMPYVGAVQSSPTATSLYTASFSHANETAMPGFYSVSLATHIQVDLTVTARTGFGQFTFPTAKNVAVLINAGGSANPDTSEGTGIQIVGNDMVTGSASSGHFCARANTYTVYFAAQFERPFVSFGTWNGAVLSPGSHKSTGSQSGAYLNFDASQNQVVRVKVGISFVSVENAQMNLTQENPGWDFAGVRAAADTAWNDRLNAIQVSGGTQEQKIVFYTALYHTLFHPNIFSDVNGQYLGFDQKVHVAQGYTQYENFPGWDMYRSLIGLLALLEPHDTGDMLQSLVMDAQQGGGALPRWEVANDNSGGMVGDSSDVVIATSYAFGVRNFQAQAALQAMDAGASQPGVQSGSYHPREGLSDYLKLGYVPTNVGGSAAITLEYTTDDFAISQLAQALGNTKFAASYLARSQNWKHLFKNGFIQPRQADGTFRAGYDPVSEDGFIESNGLQYSWMVPYDLPGLFSAMGGDAQVVKRLDTHFQQLNAGPYSKYAFMGNEPEFEVPWEYDFAGAPYRTQDVLRRIQTQLFTNEPGGLPGNDDGGAMSSWYVFSAIGLYPEIPGVAEFALGTPLFPAITLRLGNGHLLQINAPGTSNSMRYIQQLTIQGQSYNRAWLPFSLIEQGAIMNFTVDSNVHPTWGK